jgi:hypothetical protein
MAVACLVSDRSGRVIDRDTSQVMTAPSSTTAAPKIV